MVAISFLIVFLSYLMLSRERSALTWKSLIPSVLMLIASIYLLTYEGHSDFEVYFTLFSSIYLITSQALNLFTTRFKIEIPHSLIVLLPLVTIEPSYKNIIFFLVPLFALKRDLSKFSLGIISLAATLVVIDIVSLNPIAAILALILLIGVSYRFMGAIEASLWSFMLYICLPYVGPTIFWLLFAVLAILIAMALCNSKREHNWYIVQLLLICILSLSIDTTIPMNMLISEQMLFVPLFLFVVIGHLYDLKFIEHKMFRAIMAVVCLSSIVALNTDLYLIFQKQEGPLKIMSALAIVLPIYSILRLEDKAHA